MNEVTELHPIEREIIEKSGFVPEKNYKDRQDYLAALMLSVKNISNDDYEVMSDESVAWYNTAASARKDKHPIPEFEGVDVREAWAEDEEPSFTASGEYEHELNQAKTLMPEHHNDPKADKPKVTKEKRVPNRRRGAGKRAQPGYTGEVDEFGIAIGTKAHIAAKLLVQGCTMRMIVDTVGDTQYNLIKRLEKAGHKVERQGGVFKLTARQTTNAV